MARRKKSDEFIIDKLLKKAEEAKKTGLELTRIAVEQAELSGRELSKEGRKKIVLLPLRRNFLQVRNIWQC